jgi:hypothetical protein
VKCLPFALEEGDERRPEVNYGEVNRRSFWEDVTLCARPFDH